MKYRVLIVDDSVVMRRIVRQSLESDPDIEVVGVAANGKIALDMAGGNGALLGTTAYQDLARAAR